MQTVLDKAVVKLYLWATDVSCRVEMIQCVAYFCVDIVFGLMYFLSYIHK